MSVAFLLTPVLSTTMVTSLLFVVVGEVQEYKKNTVKNIAKITYIHLRFIPVAPF